MTARYRLILFQPDPFGADWVPIAGVVLDADGLGVVRPCDPPPLRLGGDDDWAAFARIFARLDDIASFDALPEVFGPYVTLSESFDVAAKDPDAWVFRLIQRNPGPWIRVRCEVAP